MSTINLQNNNIDYLLSYDGPVCAGIDCDLCNEYKEVNNTVIEVINDQY